MCKTCYCISIYFLLIILFIYLLLSILPCLSLKMDIIAILMIELPLQVIDQHPHDSMEQAQHQRKSSHEKEHTSTQPS